MVTAQVRGHKIYYDPIDKLWKYCDNDEPIDDNRPCRRCGKLPTKEGHDACLGTLNGVKNACCGHGDKRKAYIK